MAIRRSNRPVVRGPRRQTTWVGPADQGLVAVADNAKAIISSFDAAASGLAKPTVVRSRGLFAVSAQTAAADLDIIGAFGIAIVSDRAFAAGAASIPGPFTDAGWDGWFVWQAVAYRLDVSTDVGRLLEMVQYDVDSKGMRKITDDETMVVMYESQGGAARVFDGTRHLFKLS